MSGLAPFMIAEVRSGADNVSANSGHAETAMHKIYVPYLVYLMDEQGRVESNIQTVHLMILKYGMWNSSQLIRHQNKMIFNLNQQGC